MYLSELLKLFINLFNTIVQALLTLHPLAHYYRILYRLHYFWIHYIRMSNYFISSSEFNIQIIFMYMYIEYCCCRILQKTRSLCFYTSPRTLCELRNVAVCWSSCLFAVRQSMDVLFWIGNRWEKGKRQRVTQPDRRERPVYPRDIHNRVTEVVGSLSV